MSFQRREDTTQLATYKFIAERREILVQTDTLTHPVRPPESLIRNYNVLAQMLAPIVIDADTIGVTSVRVVGAN